MHALYCKRLQSSLVPLTTKLLPGHTDCTAAKGRLQVCRHQAVGHCGLLACTVRLHFAGIATTVQAASVNSGAGWPGLSMHVHQCLHALCLARCTDIQQPANFKCKAALKASLCCEVMLCVVYQRGNITWPAITQQRARANSDTALRCR